MQPENQQPPNDSDIDSLEGSNTIIEPQDGAGQPAPASQSDSTLSVAPEPGSAGNESSSTNDGRPPAPKRSFKHFLKRIFRQTNIYLLLFGLIMIVAGAIAVVSYLYSKNNETPKHISSQSLSQSTLDQLANSDVTVGDAKQVLSVESNAVFAGKVLVRNGLEVAGPLQVGGSLALTGVRVSGNSVLDDVQVSKDLAVSNNTSIQGQLTVQKGINVNGDGTFKGNISAAQVTANSLQLNGELTLVHHVTAGGPTPTRTAGNAVGNGGTATVSGSDTAGNVTINTGGSPGAGCFITVNFAQRFNGTPHVIITPVGSAAAGVAYYVIRTTGNFSICSTSTPPASQSFGFDYIVFD